MDLEATATLCNPVTKEVGGRFGYHTTETEIADFQRSGIIPGGPNARWGWNNWSNNQDITRECVHLTPVAPSHAQAVGIWRSEGHSWKQGKRTLVVDLLMFSEEARAKIYQARTGIILTKEMIPWYSVVGWFENRNQKITINADYGWFTTQMSDQPRPADETSSEPAQTHPKDAPRTTPKSEPTEEESR
eukprot:5002260-Amphidinium_carterae.1